MQAAERNVVDCLYSVIRKRTSLSFVHSIQSRFRDVRGDRSIVSPLLLQKRHLGITYQPLRNVQKPTSNRTGLFKRVRDDHVSKNGFIKVIQNELFKIGASLSDGEFHRFKNNLNNTVESWDGKVALPVLATLSKAFEENGIAGLNMQIKYLFYGEAANRAISKSDFADLQKLADLRFPADWYPATRGMQRSIHLHVGPTNSGKTYHALKRLEKAESGIYAGPLRLLAYEVYTKLNAKGIPCHLVTGDERIEQGEAANMVSCTVEMVPLNHPVDVAIIDEIQMIGSASRGWSWTQAFFGLQAKEVHLCGEVRAVPLIRELAKLLNEKLEVHYYDRLSPLQTMRSSLKGDLKNIQKGDCVVVFSKKGIHAMKKAIQKGTGKRVAIIYGDLPPETRAQQARLFNDPDNDYDFLVASDAIGMGLNLSIKRIIFQSSRINKGGSLVKIEDHQIKQIGGRAGRYRSGGHIESGVSQDKGHDTTPTNLGLVTSFDPGDFANIIKGMHSEPEPVMTAGICPATLMISRFGAYFPCGTPFSYILLRFDEVAVLHPRFHKMDIKGIVRIAESIDSVKNLTTKDRLIFCAAPVGKTPEEMEICKVFAKCVANNGGGGLLQIKELNLDILDQNINSSQDQTELELLHKSLVLYMWLGYRFIGVFPDHDMASYVKRLVQERIEKVLENSLSRSQAKREQAKIQKIERGVRTGDMVYRDPPGVDDGNANTRRDIVLPPEGGGPWSAQNNKDDLDLKLLLDEVSGIRPLERTT